VRKHRGRRRPILRVFIDYSHPIREIAREKQSRERDEIVIVVTTPIVLTLNFQRFLAEFAC
jgi:hypothetical protein